MRLDRKLTTTALFGLTALAFSGSVLADETFTFSNAGGTYTSGAYTVTATAWSDTWDGPNLLPEPDRIQTATLTHYSGGLGNVNQNGGESGTNGQHSVDNEPNDTWEANQGDRDFILFEFKNTSTDIPQAVTLNTVQLGWLSGDSDLSILALTDGTTPGDLTGIRLDDLLASGSGWTLFEAPGTGDNTASNKMRSVGAGATTSSSWIVGTSFTNTDGIFDKVKIKHLVAHIPNGGGGRQGGVPLPASIFLIAAGIPLIRRFQRAQNA